MSDTQQSSNFLEIKQLCAGYKNNLVLKNLSLSIKEGEFVALLGSSGCGKSTLLRCIAGFNQPVSGEINVQTTAVTALPPDKREMALVFQSYALWPHMSVEQNITYGLKLQRKSSHEIASRLKEMQELLGLEGLEYRKPAELSGGQRQRVALGRALAISPRILLLDEPLSNLDTRIRLQLRDQIRQIQQRLGITAIHVTHDREEAMVMADKIVVMNKGEIEQYGTPEEIYNCPRTAFVASFMGAENMITVAGKISGDEITIAPSSYNETLNISRPEHIQRAEKFQIRFRADKVKLSNTSEEQHNPEDLRLRGIVRSVTYPGGSWRHAVQVGDAVVQVHSDEAFNLNETIYLSIKPKEFFTFHG